LVLPAQAKYGGGSGTAQDPYQIATTADLIALGETPEDYDKHFVLTADIDLDPRLPGRKVFDKAVIAPDTDAKKGDFQGTPFGGVFDGNGHRISHLTIQGGNNVGLFGEVVSGAEVKDLGVLDVNITGSGYYAGGLAGSNEGTLTGCYSTGVVGGGSCVGGLVGSNGTWPTQGGIVTNCYSTGTVSGASGVGGLVGCVDGRITGLKGDVTECYSTGPVSGGSGVGGLVGWNRGHITRCRSTGPVRGNYEVGGLVGGSSGDGAVIQCYSTGAVSGKDYVGGLVGDNEYESHVAQCYSTGAVSGSDYVGGLVGWLGNSEEECGYVTECYSTGAVNGTGKCVGGLVGLGDAAALSFWDTQSSGQGKSLGGTGNTTAQMQTPKTFMAAGWNFAGEADGPDDFWAEPIDGGYPVLYWQLPDKVGLPRFSGGAGEPNDPYIISTAQELNSIGHNPRLMKCHFRLVADLDLAGLRFYPIGDYDYPYGGVFDGNGHAVSHLTIKGGDSLGLFGQLASGAEVKNLGVVDVNITSSGNRVGGLVGSSGGTVTQCYSSGAVTGMGQSVGGLVGSNGGTVTQCYSTAMVSGNSRVGGLVGGNAGPLTECYSTGAVSGMGQCVGGLVGAAEGGSTLTGCYSSGSVFGTKYVGGLVGENWGLVLTRCYSTGPVSGAENVGGLVGENYQHGTVTQCYSSGTVRGTLSVGGAVGWNFGTLTECYSHGAVNGSQNVGGLVGGNYGSLARCYSTGAVSGVNYVGGLVGDGMVKNVTACFWDTQTSGRTTSAGGTGKTTAEMQTAKTFLDAGWDFVGETANGTEDLWWILEGKDYPRLWWQAAKK
jgi:hypothetical protein